MGSSVILFGWSRSVPGREKASAGHVDEFVKYLEVLEPLPARFVHCPAPTYGDSVGAGRRPERKSDGC